VVTHEDLADDQTTVLTVTVATVDQTLTEVGTATVSMVVTETQSDTVELQTEVVTATVISVYVDGTHGGDTLDGYLYHVGTPVNKYELGVQ